VKLSLAPSKLLLTFSLTVAASGTLFADVMIGTLGLGGSNASVAQTSIVFNCPTTLDGATCPAPAGEGNFIINSGTGVTSSYVSTGGYITDLSETTTPLNTPFTLANWLTFDGVSFNLASTVLGPPLPTGNSGQADCLLAPAPGQTCTPVITSLVGSPNDPMGLSNFNLQNTANGFTASFDVNGTVTGLPGEGSTPYYFNGQFTATVPNYTSYQAALAAFAGLSPTTPLPFQFSYAASFNIFQTAVPEPGYLVMLAGFGILLAVGGIYRKSRLAKQN